MARIRDVQRERSRIVPSVRGGAVTGEYGASGTQNIYGRIYGEDYNTLFDGKNGLALFDQMDRSDAQVGAASDIIKLPIRAAQWRCVPPDDATAKEKEIADAVNLVLFESNNWPSGESWDFYLRHLLMRVSHGFGLLEKIWTFDDDSGLLKWRRLAPRLPKTVDKFMTNPDGSLRAVVQYVAPSGTANFSYKEIPAEYCVLSVRDREGDNYFGRSVYRRLYKHWFYKDEAYRIDGIRLDRYGVGIPVAKLGENASLSNDDLTEIELVLRSLRSHERAYIIETHDVDFRIMVPDGGHGGATGLMESVQHHDTMIVRGVLATFMSDHAEGLNTNRTRTLADIFLHSLKGEAAATAGDVVSQLIRPFCNLNFDMTDARYPNVQISGIGDLTVEQISTYLSPLITAGAVTADDSVEDQLRKIFGLEPLPDGWKRGDKKPEVPAPSVGGGNPDDDDNPEESNRELAIALDSLSKAIANNAHAPQASPVVINFPAEGKTKARRVEYDAMTGRVSKVIEE